MAMSERTPDFFIVGHHKSGTSALYEMLRGHPQIFLSSLKEPRYMASDMRERFSQPRERRHPQTLEEYLTLFADARLDQRAGEASATYLWSHTAASRIAQLQPAARIVAILREPASFLHSLHLTYLRAHVESEKDFRTAMSLEAARREGRRIPRRSHLPRLQARIFLRSSVISSRSRARSRPCNVPITSSNQSPPSAANSLKSATPSRKRCRAERLNRSKTRSACCRAGSTKPARVAPTSRPWPASSAR